jgi:hypothetical protein
VIAAGYYFDAEGQEVFGDTRCNAEAGCSILTISDDNIDLTLLHEVGEAIFDDTPTGRTYNVTNKKNAYSFG